MEHPLVEQLRFTRSEWLRGLDGITDDESRQHFGQMNCIGWTVGHLAWQEQRYFLQRAQDRIPFPVLNSVYAYGAPMSSPPLSTTFEIWREITSLNAEYLAGLTTDRLLMDLPLKGKESGQSNGSAIHRMTYHYWYHIGEIQAIRQLLGHPNLPEYVGDIETQAPYRPGI